MKMAPFSVDPSRANARNRESGDQAMRKLSSPPCEIQYGRLIDLPGLLRVEIGDPEAHAFVDVRELAAVW